MSWRIVKDSLLVGRFAASKPLKPLQGSQRKVAAFDLVGHNTNFSHPVQEWTIDVRRTPH